MTAHARQTIFVTGASAGFGTAIVRRFAAKGARVVAAARHDAVQPGVVEDGGDLTAVGDHVQHGDVLLPGDGVQQHHGATVRRDDHAAAVR